MKNEKRQFKIIYPPNFDDLWKEEVTVTNHGENLKWLLVFSGRVPHTAFLRVRLAGIRTRAEFIICYLGKGMDDTAMDITFIHDAPETYGRITAKAALFDQAKFTLRGMLEITPRGKGSDTYLSAKGLLVSPRARAEIYPYLEIQTDEVRASHGTSVGRIDEKQLFYLQSRGIRKKEAEKIILSEYFRDIARELPAPYAEKFFQIGYV